MNQKIIALAQLFIKGRERTETIFGNGKVMLHHTDSTCLTKENNRNVTEGVGRGLVRREKAAMCDKCWRFGDWVRTMQIQKVGLRRWM